MTRRSSSATLLSLLLVLGCGAEPETGILDPVVAEAPGGEKGKPGGGSGGGKGGGGGGGGETADPALEEYFITEVGGQQHIHVVASGSVGVIAANPILDHFHNGVGDDDPPYDEHYEYFLFGSSVRPAPAPVEGHDGLHHVDIPFSGTFGDWDPDLGDYVEVALPDYPYTNVGGAGGDPWVFQIVIQSEDGSTTLRRRPEPTAGENVVGHAVQDAFVVHQGVSPGSSLWLESLSLDAVSCTETTVRSGKGRNKTVETVLRVEAEVAYATASDGDATASSPWVEVHLLDEATGAFGPRQTTTADASTGVPVALELSGDRESVEVTAVVDYVFADPAWGVYDPAGNQVATTAGVGPDAFGSVQALGDPAPFARSASVTVTCQ